MGAELTVSTRRVTLALSATMIVLVVMGFAVDYVTYGLNHKITGITYLFDFDQKTNFPTAFKLLALVTSAALLWIIASAKKRGGDSYARHWMVLSLIFLYLTLDEEARLHQMIGARVREIFHTSGIFHHGWVLIYLPLVAIFVVAYVRFLLDLPATTRVLFVLAGICYAGGSGGVELAKGYIKTRYCDDCLLRAMVGDFSDTLEVIGLVIFVHVLLAYLSTYVKEAELRFTDGGS